VLILDHDKPSWPSDLTSRIDQDSYNFGILLDYFFRNETYGAPPREVPLFRTLQTAIRHFSRYAEVEEYHGSVSQVEFTPPAHASYNWTRPNPKCELADLLIVVFTTRDTPSIRLTLFQAKSERNWRSPDLSDLPWFKGNLEQWDLLSRRPQISGAYSTFSPPRGLLHDAVLPSVGSFGFFFRRSANSDYNLYYTRASSLQPTFNYANRHGGRLIVSDPNLYNEQHGYAEACRANSICSFGALLHSHLIGTPIHPDADQYNDEASRRIRNWLVNSVRQAVEEKGIETGGEGIEVGQRFLETYGDDVEVENANYSFGAKSLLLINTDAASSYGEVLERIRAL
jgi:hypothetical protein